jgi:nucleoside-diphosphate-sugar epimerase
MLLSSIYVYGRILPAKRFEETDSGALDSLNPRNAYAVAKRASENLCACYFAQCNVPVIIVRPAQIMGGGVALDDGRLHIDFISQILSSGKIVLKSDGSAKRTFIYITDAITGMLTALLKGARGEAYNVVDENGEATVLELANLIASLARDKKAEVVFDYDKRNSPEVTNAVSCVTGSSEKLRALGWKPKLALREGALRMMSYYGAQNFNKGDSL